MKADELREGWKYLSRYSIGGFVHMISMWLDSDMAYPKETLLEMMRELDHAIDPLYDKY